MPELVQVIAECIPTVRVVKVVSGDRHTIGFWSISRSVAGEGEIGAGHSQGVKSGVSCDKWNIREQAVTDAVPGRRN